MEPEEFVDEVVKKWMYHDIREAIRGKANFLATLGLMAYTEIMGGLVTGKLRGELVKGKWKSRSKENFKEFVKKYFPPSYHSHVDLLYKKVRCGLVHEYFIKEHNKTNPVITYFTQNLGIIINNPDDPDVQNDYGLSCAVESVENGRINFHVNQYFKDFQKVVEKYLENVRKNSKLREQFYKVFPKSSYKYKQ